MLSEIKKSLRNLYVVLSMAFLAIPLQGAEKDAYVPLFKFDSAVSVKQWKFNPWGGEKKAEISFEESDEKEGPAKFMRITYSGNATLSSSALSQILLEKIAAKSASKFYLRYRVEALTGKAQFQYNTKTNGATYSYYNTLGLNRNPKWQCIEMSLGGWNKENETFHIAGLCDLLLIFHGSGTIDISEIGVVYELLPQKITFTTPSNYLPAGFDSNITVKIDGEIDNKEWERAGEIKNLKLAENNSVNTQNKTTTYIQASPEGLYCAAKCYKTDMSKLKAEYKANSVRIYLDESIEFSVDPGRTTKTFHKIAINANGCFGGVLNTLDNTGIKAMSKKYSDRWETEVFIPWKFFEINPDEPLVLGFNVTRNCYDTGRLERSGWTTTVWNNVSEFGVVGLEKNPSNSFSNALSAQAGKIKAGSYLFMGNNASETMNCRISITSPDKSSMVFNQQIGNGSYKIPVQFKTVSADKYHIDLLIWDTSGIKTFQEMNVSEEIYTSLKSLDIDEIALFPIPKIFNRIEGFVALDTNNKINIVGSGIDFCGERLISELEKFYALTLKTTKSWQDANIVIGLSSSEEINGLIKSLEVESDFKQIQYDGFAVIITSKKILVAANEKRGLYYGVNALLELIKMSSGDVGTAKVCKAKVIDWPRSEFRFFHQMMHAYFPRNKYNVDFFTDILQRFPMLFRFNGFSFEVADYYKWESANLRHAYSWDKKEYSQVIDFVNRRYMPVMPSIQSHGHMKWWLFKGDQFQSLREAGSNDVICTGNPDSYKLLFKIYNEAWELCSHNPEFAPKHFITSLDEVRWKVSPEKECKYCKDIPKNKIFLEHIKKLNSFITKKDAKMMMFTDMLVEGHNGLNEFKCSEIVEEIPKDVIMCHWSNLDFPSIGKFSKLGLENWKFLTAYSESRIGEKQVKGYAFNNCSYHWWLSRNRCATNGMYGLMVQALFLNNCWNSLPDDGSPIWLKDTRIYGNLLMRNWSRKPLLNAGEKIYTLNLDEVVNKSVTGAEGWFGEGEEFDLSKVDFDVKQIAGIPVKFSRDKDGTKCFIPDHKSAGVIMLEKKAASLILLHAAHLDPKNAEKYWDVQYYKDPLDGKKTIEYTVSYTDNSKTIFHINYGWNISEWRINPLVQNEVFSKYLADSRFILEAKTPYADKANIGNDISIYQYEWVNPFPDKVIKSISLNALEQYVSYGLLAISAREIK